MKILLALLLFPLAAAGRIGETRAQISGQYGSAGASGDNWVYRRGEYSLEVTYENGRSVAETIYKTPPDALTTPLPDSFSYEGKIARERLSEAKIEHLTAEEIASLLKVYSGGQTWTGEKYERSWDRSDGLVHAELHRLEFSDKGLSFDQKIRLENIDGLYVASVEYLRRSDEKRKLEQEHAESAAQVDADAKVMSAFGSQSTPVPRAEQLVTPADVFAKNVAYSQQSAVAKYPTLATAGSPLNRAFLARLADWKARNDPRLQKSDWPERLADDCAINP